MKKGVNVYNENSQRIKAIGAKNNFNSAFKAGRNRSENDYLNKKWGDAMAGGENYVLLNEFKRQTGLPGNKARQVWNRMNNFGESVNEALDYVYKKHRNKIR